MVAAEAELESPLFCLLKLLCTYCLLFIISYNVAEPQLRMIKEAIARGMDVMNSIVLDPDGHSWQELYAGPDFFGRFNDYIEASPCHELEIVVRELSDCLIYSLFLPHIPSPTFVTILSRLM